MEELAMSRTTLGHVPDMFWTIQHSDGHGHTLYGCPVVRSVGAG